MMLKTLGQIAFVMTGLLVMELAAAILAFAGIQALQLHPEMAPVGWGLLAMAAVCALVMPFIIISETRTR